MFVQLAEFWWGQHVVTGPANSQLASQPATVYRHKVSTLSALLESYFAREQQCGQHFCASGMLQQPTIKEYISQSNSFPDSSNLHHHHNDPVLLANMLVAILA